MTAHSNLTATAKLGFGLMRLPLQGEAIDLAQLSRMADLFIQQGFSYFDTAYVYHGGKSETAFRQAVALRQPRAAFTIADKLPAWELKQPADVDRIFNEQLERCGVSYFDFYLLHSINAGHLKIYEAMDCFKWGQDMKAQGKIRYFGFSFHDNAALLDQILTKHPEVDFVQLQINYFDWDNPAIDSRGCYETARRHNKNIVIMEPVKGGVLAALPAPQQARLRAVQPQWSDAAWALRFAGGLDGVIAVLSGMSERAQMEDNLRTMLQLRPLTAAEATALEQVSLALRQTPTVGCTACRYCVDGCPEQIKIPDIIRVYNDFLVYGAQPQRQQAAYRRITATAAGPASACIQCGQCESVCPQHLPVIDLMAQAASVFEA
ncbi:MAG: aldo/keto reductase [Oscillospiraceae bacterium]|nr:aldo/keto reductase [Oscillospiraceae bacterium]MDD4367846.1 aldo/keto reductase [Oscillospiraceae bacterium]